MTNLSNVKFCNSVDDAQTISITLESGNEWTVQLEGGKFKRDAGCFIYLNDEHFMSYKNNADELAEQEQAISEAEDFYEKWSIENEQLDKVYEKATIALGEGCMAMDKLVALVTSKQLTQEDFKTFIGAMSHHNAKLLEGVK